MTETNGSTVTECTDLLDEAFLNAQGEFTEIAKDKFSEFHQDYYSSLESILKATRPALIKYKLLFTHDIESTETGVRVTAVLKHIPSKQVIRRSLSCDCGRTDPQKIGSAITYLRKYTTYPTLGIAPDEDDDGQRAVPDRKSGSQERRRRGDSKQTSTTNGAKPPAQSPPPTTTQSPKLVQPAGWPNSEPPTIMRWIDALPEKLPAWQWALTTLKNNGPLYNSSVDWPPVLTRFADRLRKLIHEDKIDKTSDFCQVTVLEEIKRMTAMTAPAEEPVTQGSESNEQNETR